MSESWAHTCRIGNARADGGTHQPPEYAAAKWPVFRMASAEQAEVLSKSHTQTDPCCMWSRSPGRPTSRARHVNSVRDNLRHDAVCAILCKQRGSMLLREGCLPAISRATECPYWPRTADPRKKSCHDLCVLRRPTMPSSLIASWQGRVQVRQSPLKEAAPGCPAAQATRALDTALAPCTPQLPSLPLQYRRSCCRYLSAEHALRPDAGSAGC